MITTRIDGLRWRMGRFKSVYEAHDVSSTNYPRLLAHGFSGSQWYSARRTENVTVLDLSAGNFHNFSFVGKIADNSFLTCMPMVTTNAFDLAVRYLAVGIISLVSKSEAVFDFPAHASNNGRCKPHRGARGYA